MMRIEYFYWILFLQIMFLNSFVNSIHCPSCEKIHCRIKKLSKLRCKGGTTRGICGCCPTCAKVEGERCGGDFAYLGKCDVGLYCKMETPKYVGREPDGVCQLVPVQIQDAPVRRGGCRPRCSPEFCTIYPRAICSAV
ncbi:hypothetical protein FSP39_000609 [Pinctada imbricata]|uniref:IGFBP N-terminal domain-containing protein n=1 Tax=Pinctada imbricata TaxID=66713 RepID=A0AA88Y194_PINIB|nr:hypothetical protein FSP39_000609 [Pinctada imbricata]